MARHGNIGAIRVFHGIREKTEIRLENTQHILHRLGGNTDLLPHHALTVLLHAPAQHVQADVIGIVNGDVRRALGERRQSTKFSQGMVELIAQSCAAGLIHDEGSPRIHD